MKWVKLTLCYFRTYCHFFFFLSGPCSKPPIRLVKSARSGGRYFTVRTSSYGPLTYSRLVSVVSALS